MKNYKVIGLASLLLTACTPLTRFSITNVNDFVNIDNSSCIYALPLTAFAVAAEAQKESFIPGPYWMYAEKYLGIKGAQSETSDSWMIVDLQISTYTEADPDFIFSINNLKGKSRCCHLTELGQKNLILLPEDMAVSQMFEHSATFYRKPEPYVDLSVKRNFEMDKGGSISVMLPDSITGVRPPQRNAELPVPKTLEKKAEEAANFIIKIRKRRFKLISGQYDFMPDGEALGRAVDELNQTEADYLSLFIGRKTITRYKRTFSFVPGVSKESLRTILFRFSESQGFLDVGEAGGKPVMLDLVNMNKTKGLGAFKTRIKEDWNKLYYRVPDQASVNLYYGEQVVGEARVPVYQFGNFVSINIR